MKISQLIKLARAVHHLRRIKMAAMPSVPKNTYPAVPNVPKGTSPALSMAAKGRTFDEGGSSYDARVARAAGMKPGSPEYNSYMQNAQNARYATGAQAEMRAMGGGASSNVPVNIFGNTFTRSPVYHPAMMEISPDMEALGRLPTWEEMSPGMQQEMMRRFGIYNYPNY